MKTGIITICVCVCVCVCVFVCLCHHDLNHSVCVCVVFCILCFVFCVFLCVCIVCVVLCVCVRARACVRACVRVCAYNLLHSCARAARAHRHTQTSESISVCLCAHKETSASIRAPPSRGVEDTCTGVSKRLRATASAVIGAVTCALCAALEAACIQTRARTHRCFRNWTGAAGARMAPGGRGPMRKRRKKTAAVVAPGMGKSPPHTPAPTDAPRSDQAICDAGTRTRLCLQDGARGGAGARFSTLRERGCGRKRRRAAAAAARCEPEAAGRSKERATARDARQVGR